MNVNHSQFAHITLFGSCFGIDVAFMMVEMCTKIELVKYMMLSNVLTGLLLANPCEMTLQYGLDPFDQMCEKHYGPEYALAGPFWQNLVWCHINVAWARFDTMIFLSNVKQPNNYVLAPLDVLM